MATRTIAEKGDPILRKHCKPVKNFNDRLKVLAEDMIETMDQADGVGLAAPQVSVMKRMITWRRSAVSWLSSRSSQRLK